MTKWFVEQRLAWIAETVRARGYINRKDLQDKFGISTPQASHDLSEFQRLNPGVIEYDASLKRYVATKGGLDAVQG